MTNAATLLIGITGNSVVHTDADTFDLETRFRMVSEAGVFDYYERSPPPHELDLHLRMSERYKLPIRAGGFFYTLERDEPLLDWHLRIGGELGAKVQNIQLRHLDANGVPVSNARVAAAYLHAAEVGAKVGVTPCFEVHVDMWSEHFGRVEEVARLVEREGVPFNMTLDASHVIFKIGNTGEQQVQGMLADVQAGRVRLDPFDKHSVIHRWISGNLVGHAHARPAVPNNPVNVWSSGPDGRPGRGIQYPFRRPPADAWHSAWDEAALEPWKHVMRTLLAHHARAPSSRLGHISTEILPFHDYGAGSRYSLFDDSVACARWLRETWTACSNNEARGVMPDTRHNLPNGPGLAGQPATTGAQQ
ncbi:xylose isomerase [Paraburkholderia fungorum]|uniref:xylose isomerase n=1 Tax=Paraburkholderia fungorum TaxID=134537 RepID=UPI0038BC23E6